MIMVLDKPGPGRPLSLPPAYAELGNRIRSILGASDREVAAVFGVDLATWRRMRRRAAIAAGLHAQKHSGSGGAAPLPAPAPQRLARDLRRVAARLQMAVQ